jgi:signal transduction histidine kinase
VTDAAGKCVAHGADAGRVGKNIMNATDVDGKSYIRERYEIARATGSGWQEYKYKNPANGKIEAKRVYIDKFEDLVIASGAYKP